ncbi:NADP-dependent phosphogluconate dehydrogenase [Phaeobacter sp. B1627]|uniref:NADP-dependent phosphogluconate dehydrogenase n=1 Tax=Phaeobacter sp. B1627 TaxID=2583809 RepID=UPI00111B6C09|nr:NADP-dependent phosphogluconate dehydrogenase [Phaeobacter sp. B1627]TNJ43290.1 NADP-dependent phosphogluconate dehydrogenase [Phaeobacter sp. B1627]
MTANSTVGLIGLGTMGAALALNIAENGFRISVFNRTTSVVDEFVSTAGELAEQIVPTRSLTEFVASLQRPRTIILMVPAGPVVDAQIEALRGYLDAGDLVIDAGNANYHDTNRRMEEAAQAPYSFLGVGVSGGEDGARHGPSIMVGGQQDDWLRVAPMLKSISAKYEDESCADYMGAGGAGHFVKMVHNGIEYADMQMIAEGYSLMSHGMSLPLEQIAAAFDEWNKGPLSSYLIEISGQIAHSRDRHTGAPILDVILDRAGQKGTGRWTAIEAQHLGVAVPVIEAAVCARNLSAGIDNRAAGAAAFGELPDAGGASTDLTLAELEQALIAGKILCYAQGFDMLAAASSQFDWDLPMDRIAKVWRNGCIIRSDMLNEMAQALADKNAPLLIFSEPFTEMLRKAEPALRKTVQCAIAAGIAVPALSAGLSWFDTIRTRRSSANVIQAQRDFFGAHGFERTDAIDDPHGPWSSNS